MALIPHSRIAARKILMRDSRRIDRSSYDATHQTYHVLGPEGWGSE